MGQLAQVNKESRGTTALKATTVSKVIKATTEPKATTEFKALKVNVAVTAQKSLPRF